MDIDFNKLCTPAKIYFALTVFSCIILIFHRVSILVISTKLIFAFIWAIILGWLCKKGYKSLSWFLVLFPFILIGLSLIGIVILK
jgi:hypothetical protein